MTFKQVDKIFSLCLIIINEFPEKMSWFKSSNMIKWIFKRTRFTKRQFRVETFAAYIVYCTVNQQHSAQIGTDQGYSAQIGRVNQGHSAQIDTVFQGHSSQIGTVNQGDSAQIDTVHQGHFTQTVTINQEHYAKIGTENQ